MVTLCWIWSFCAGYGHFVLDMVILYILSHLIYDILPVKVKALDGADVQRQVPATLPPGK